MGKGSEGVQQSYFFYQFFEKGIGIKKKLGVQQYGVVGQISFMEIVIGRWDSNR